MSEEPIVKRFATGSSEVWVPLRLSARLGIRTGRKTPEYVGLLGVGEDLVRDRPSEPPSHRALFDATVGAVGAADLAFAGVYHLWGQEALQATAVGVARRDFSKPWRSVTSAPLGEFDDLVELAPDEVLRQLEAMPHRGRLAPTPESREYLERLVREPPPGPPGTEGAAIAQVAVATRPLPETPQVSVAVAGGCWSPYGGGIARMSAKGVIEAATLGRRGWFGRMRKRLFMPMSEHDVPWREEG